MKKYILFKDGQAVGKVEVDKLSPNQGEGIVYEEVNQTTFDRELAALTSTNAGEIVVDNVKEQALKLAKTQRAQRTADVESLKGKATLTAADQQKVLKYVVENLL